MAIEQVCPGDVLAVSVGGGWRNPFGYLVKLFQRIAGKSHEADHVVIVTHRDALGRWMGIEGRPSGVGLCDCSQYLDKAATRSNHDQPKIDDAGQLATFLASTAKSLGIAYDWVGIFEDAFDSIGLRDLSREIDHLWRWGTAELPGHVVCSSLAARLYTEVGWAEPTGIGPDRVCMPADWWTWADQRLWEGQ